MVEFRTPSDTFYIAFVCTVILRCTISKNMGISETPNLHRAPQCLIPFLNLEKKKRIYFIIWKNKHCTCCISSHQLKWHCGTNRAVVQLQNPHLVGRYLQWKGFLKRCRWGLKGLSGGTPSIQLSPISFGKLSYF